MQNILLQLARQDEEGNIPQSKSGMPSVDLVGNQKNTLTSDVTSIINAVIGVLGLICVIIMIIGGVNYMTSSGDPGKVKKSKDIILYGLIGLIICVLAFAIVNWVIGGLLSQ